MQVEGRRLTLSNLDKVLYPEAGFTKAQVLDYYRRVAPVMLPHLRGRPVTLKRFPEGVAAESFFEKRAPPHRPSWVATAKVVHKGDAIEFCVVDDVATLVWLANLAALELHPQLHVAEDPERPTVMVFDLDPGAPAGLLECCAVALRLREVLEDLGLRCFPKASGLKGLQLYVPLHSGASYDDTKAFSRGLAKVLERERPKEVVSRMRKDLRAGKVFIDWSQNDQIKTTVCAYSLRAHERPRVSAPVAWAEVEHALDAHDREGLVFEAEQVLARVRRHGDLFAQVATLKQELPALA